METRSAATFPLPAALAGGGSLLLRARDDAMADAGIGGGDWVLVREQDTAGDGQIAAVMHAGDAIIRTYTRRDGGAWLAAADPGHAPVPAGDVTVIGVVTAVIRRLLGP